MKKHFILALMLLTCGVMFAQVPYVRIEERQTTYETLIKQPGVQCRIVDENLPALYGLQSQELEVAVRSVQVKGTMHYFYRLLPKATHDKPETAVLVTYEDLVELNRILETMIGEERSDRSSRKDYAENIYTTSEGFQIGYCTKSRNTSWFIVLGPYNETRIYFENGTRLKESFQKALAKVDELRRKTAN